MNLRIATFVIVVAIAVLAVLAWQRSAAPPPAQESAATAPAEPQGAPATPGGQPSATPSMPGGMPGGMPSAPTQDPGVAWDVPQRWVAELATGMRLATYGVPSTKAGGPSGSCAVYYFGPGQGGGVDANLERWSGEFRETGHSARRSFETHGLRVSRIEVRGTYAAHAMAPGAGNGETPGWMLLGAIVEGPNGSVFFKLTGPEATVASAAKEFDGLLGSLRKKS